MDVSTWQGPRLTAESIRAYNRTRFGGPRELLCYSPFTSLYFGMDGKVVACCQNRKQVLGVYPRESIREIWNGDKLAELREYIRNDDLRGGCASCATHIRNGNHIAVVARKFDAYPVLGDYPASMEFELHNTCNLECIMCCGDLSSSIRRNREKMPAKATPYDDAFLEQLAEFTPHLRMTTFFGGEPFLIRLYHRIWNQIIEKNPECAIMVQTNGTIRNALVDDFLARGNFQFGISLDSIHKETYEAIRVNASFDRVLENVDYFADYASRRGKPVVLAMCVMQCNWREVPEYLAFADRIGAVVFFNTVWYPHELSLCNGDSSSVEEIVRYYRDNLPHGGAPTSAYNRASLEGYISLLDSWREFMNLLEGRGLDVRRISDRGDEADRVAALMAKDSGFRDEAERLNPFPRSLQDLLSQRERGQPASWFELM